MTLQKSELAALATCECPGRVHSQHNAAEERSPQLGFENAACCDVSEHDEAGLLAIANALGEGFPRGEALAVLNNICSVLSCSHAQVENVQPIKVGLTNLSFKFEVAGAPYVYRHPGVGTDEIITRESETYSQAVAKKLGIDDTFIYEDPKEGWKISRFVEGCVEFDYHNPDHVKRAMELGHALHGSGEGSAWSFDVYEKARGIVALLECAPIAAFPDFEQLGQAMCQLAECVRGDEVAPCLCHNDFYAPNFLVANGEMSLIDWEYSALSDYASDLGTFICCSDYTMEEACEVLACYFGRTPTPEERRHCLAYVALASYYWFVWALYKESTGDPVGEWLELWHGYAGKYSKVALELYGCERE